MPSCAETRDFIPITHGDLDQSLAARFEQQVQRYPDKPAIRTRSQTVSYSELNNAANLLAATLCHQAADDEVPVAVFFEQSVSQIMAILAVLKTGRVYVPLDPADPSDRTDFMLRDSGATLVLTNEENYREASAWESIDCTILNTASVAGMTNDGGIPLVDPDSPACIYYTSGTTGKPKGVYDSHRNVLHNVMRYTNKLHITADDGMLLLQPCTFSGSVSNIFCSLLNGATLFPVDLRVEGVDGLAELLVSEPITIYHSVPAIFRQLMTGPRRFPGLRVVRLEGDQSSMQHVRLFQQKFDIGCILVNGLGATETGIIRMFAIEPGSVLTGAVVPVGYATEDMVALLVDESGSEVPAGEVGELMIRSRYLACGYWRDPELTRARFRPCPVDPEYRIYRTGDLGRMRPEGCLELLGRRDFQVKVMGCWVNIPELESALTQVEGISEAVVSLQDGIEDARLVACLVPLFPGSPPTVSAIRQALEKQKPGEVLPSAYLMIDALPLDANGKLDRKSLPSPSLTRPQLDQPYAAPGNAIEEVVAAIWSDVLGIPKVGVNDNYLYLGGDSIKAMVILNRMNEEFRLALSLSDIFKYSTVAKLARIISDS